MTEARVIGDPPPQPKPQETMDSFDPETLTWQEAIELEEETGVDLGQFLTGGKISGRKAAALTWIIEKRNGSMESFATFCGRPIVEPTVETVPVKRVVRGKSRATPSVSG